MSTTVQPNRTGLLQTGTTFPRARTGGRLAAVAREVKWAPALSWVSRWPLRAIEALVARTMLAPALAFTVVMAYFALRAFLLVEPEGDSALHLHLMATIAAGELPTSVPFFAAVVEQGGEIKELFPYAYTPLYHLLGGALFRLGGEPAVLMMGPFFAGLIAIGIVHLLRPYPWPVMGLALLLVFGHWLTQPIMTWVFMEPMVLAFFIGGLYFYQRAWVAGSTRDAAVAGLLFGLAVATRQNALFYVAFVAAHGGATVAFVLSRNGRERLRPLLSVYGVMAGAAVLIALPALGYLVWQTGSIGYASLSLPGLEPALSIDPEANAYLTSITTQSGSPVAWLDEFWHWTLFTARWQLRPLAFLPLLPFCIGLVYLWRRPDYASKFLATYVPLHIVGEMFQIMTVHGNWRYIVASRVLFYVVVAVGVWCIVAWMYRVARNGASWNPALTGVAAGALAIGAMVPGFVTPGLVDYLANSGAARAEKGEAYRQLGEFVDEHVPEDALILSGRWYTTGWYLERNYTWVTYYGNAWVIDAISTPSATRARAVLEDYGVDYVIIQAPPPTYVDQMPRDGLRQVVLDDLVHFRLLFTNERTRLYQFRPDGAPD